MRQSTKAGLWIVGYLAAVAFPLLVLLFPPTAPGLGYWWDLSMALGFGALAVMGVQFWLTARFRRVAAPFGIDILYYFHRWVAVGGLLLAIAHWTVLRVTAPEAMRPVLPPAALWHMTAGRLALLLLILLVVTSLWRKQLRLEYDRWRIAHAAMSVGAVLFAVWHVAGTAYYTGTPGKRWTWILYITAWVGLVVWVRLLKPWRLLARPWRITDVRPERGHSWTLTVEPTGHDGITFEPGQFAWLTVDRSPFAAKEHPFSIASSAASKGSVEFTIKELGDFTSTIGQTPVGARAWVDGPFGVFSPDRHPGAPGFVMVAGGVGIAPMISMLRTFADRGEVRPIVLIYGNNTLDDVIFLEELDTLAAHLDLKVVHVLRDPPAGWSGESGLVTGDILRRTLPEDAHRFTYFLCGPGLMTDAVQSDLRALGVPLRRIHVELFDMV